MTAYDYIYRYNFFSKKVLKNLQNKIYRFIFALEIKQND